MDNAVISLISALMGEGTQELINSPESYYLFCFTTKAVELFGIVIIQIWLKKHFHQGCSTFLDWLKMLIFPLSTLVVSFLLIRIYYYEPNVSYELAICNAVILVLDVSSIFILDFLEQQQEAARDNVILRRNIKNELDKVEAWRKAYDGQRKQTHDFQNQLLVIHGLVQQQAPKDEVLKYIERLQKVDIPGAMLVKTHRTAIDVILNQKLSIAKGLNIKFTAQLDDLTAFPLPDDALVAVLSNLIDNAIEASKAIENEEDRRIALKMRVEGRAAFLYIENTTATPVNVVGNKVATTKSDSIEHGYGLQNVAAIMDSCSAIYSLNYTPDSKVFSFSAQIAME